MNEYDSNRIFDSVKKIGFIKTESLEEQCYINRDAAPIKKSFQRCCLIEAFMRVFILKFFIQD